MKKILLVALFAVMAIGASAQNGFRVWYGVNIAGNDADGVDSEFKALNIGVDYTAAIGSSAFDWSAGLSYQTKGFKDWDPGYLQLEGNGVWNFVKNDAFKVGIFTGPYVAFNVADDDADPETVDFGWQGGVQGYYKKVSLKIGYEYGFLDVAENFDSKPWQVFFRVGYTF